MLDEGKPTVTQLAPTPVEQADPTLERLEDQIRWYDTRGRKAQVRFKVLRGQVMIAAAAIPVLAAFDAPGYVAAILGSVVVVTEGILQLNQYHQNWITYRSTAEALKHEKYLFLARADIYARPANPTRLLAERIEGLVSQEHGRWASTRRQVSEKGEDEDGS
jgi:hypothetical protein